MKFLKYISILFFFNFAYSQDFQLNGRDIVVAGTALVSGVGLSKFYEWLTTPKMPNFDEDYKRYQAKIDQASSQIEDTKGCIKDVNTILLSTLKYLELNAQRQREVIQESCFQDDLLQRVGQVLDLSSIKNFVGTLELKTKKLKDSKTHMSENVEDISRLILHKNTRAEEKRFKPEQKAELKAHKKEEKYLESSSAVIHNLEEFIPQAEFNHDFLDTHTSFFECYNAAKKVADFFAREIDFITKSNNLEDGYFESLICSKFPEDSCYFYYYSLKLNEEIKKLEELKSRLKFNYPKFVVFLNHLLLDLSKLVISVNSHPKFMQHQNFHFLKVSAQEQKEIEERQVKAKEEKAEAAKRSAAAQEALARAEHERNNGLIQENRTYKTVIQDLKAKLSRASSANSQLSSENQRLRDLLTLNRVVIAAEFRSNEIQ